MDVDVPNDYNLSDETVNADIQPPVATHNDQDVEHVLLTSSSTTNPHNDAPIASARRPNNWERREIAKTTLEVLDHGSFELEGQFYDLLPTKEALIEGTTFYPPDSELEQWSKGVTADGGKGTPSYNTEINIVQCSTLEGCLHLHEGLAGLEGEIDRRIGVLNFASAKKPGGGFLTGAQAQEETIARSSSLYASLMIDTAQQFYDLHHQGPKDGYYTHAMIYSPRVQLFRHDSGEWHAPIEVDVLTSPAVNAGDVRRKTRWEVDPDEVERQIESVMKERMGRLLYLFETHRVKNLVLGSFGTGVFRNSVELVAKLWIELLVAEGSRFERSFERVLFAIIDTPTVTKFREVFEESGSRLKVKEAAEAQESRAGEHGEP